MTKLHLYKVAQRRVARRGQFQEIIVAAESELDARHVNPNGGSEQHNTVEENRFGIVWPHPLELEVTYLGEAASHVEYGLITADFVYAL
jgi:hypothetical protein